MPSDVNGRTLERWAPAHEYRSAEGALGAAWRLSVASGGQHCAVIHGDRERCYVVAVRGSGEWDAAFLDGRIVATVCAGSRKPKSRVAGGL